MNHERFYHIVQHPEEMEEQDLADLQQLGNQYPYFALVPILKAKYAESQHKEGKEQLVEEASAYVLNRKAFRDYLKGAGSIPPEAQPHEAGDPLPTHKPSQVNASKAQDLKKEAEKEFFQQEERAELPEQENRRRADIVGLSTKEARSGEQQLHEQKEPTTPKEAQQEIAPESKSTETEQQSEASKPAAEKKEPKPERKEPMQAPYHQGISLYKKPIKNKKAAETPRKERLIRLDAYWDPPSIEDQPKAAPIKEKQRQVIEDFIKKQPSISNQQKASPQIEEEADLSERSTRISTLPISETWARLLDRQQKYLEAIRVYEQLKLKNPEKSAYFARIIESLKAKAQDR